jgi:predicted DNA-binding protein (UPF0251 family)
MATPLPSKPLRNNEYLFLIMVRPKKHRWVCCEPSATFFKPRGKPLTELQEVCLTVEELGAVRLKDLEGLDQEPTAAKMGISQPIVHRIVVSAHRKIADAFVNGKTVRIEGGTYVVGEDSANRRGVAERSSRSPKSTGRTGSEARQDDVENQT